MKLVKAVLAVSLGAAIAASSMSAVQAKQITIGFSQIGAESEWRTANTNDVKAAAKAHNINLKFSDAQQKQENQIKAIRTFIAQKVDLIGFVPIVATGWDNILREAKRAKIPVLVMDRDLTVSDPSLYVAKIGTDSYTEGRKVFDWLDTYVHKNNVKPRNGGDKLNIVILEGTVGASATTGRGNGFNDALKESPNIRHLCLSRRLGTRARRREPVRGAWRGARRHWGNGLGQVHVRKPPHALLRPNRGHRGARRPRRARAYPHIAP